VEKLFRVQFLGGERLDRDFMRGRFWANTAAPRFNRRFESIAVSLVVGVVLENVLTLVATIHHVIHRAWVLNAPLARQ
jgi:hypothetical protein